MSEYVTVPREPTEEMLDTACAKWAGLYPGFEGEKPRPTAGDVAGAVYRAMLSAVPPAPACGPFGGDALLQQARALCYAIETLPGGAHQTELISRAGIVAHALQQLQRTGDYFWPRQIAPAPAPHSARLHAAMNAVMTHIGIRSEQTAMIYAEAILAAADGAAPAASSLQKVQTSQSQDVKEMVERLTRPVAMLGARGSQTPLYANPDGQEAATLITAQAERLKEIETVYKELASNADQLFASNLELTSRAEAAEAKVKELEEERDEALLLVGGPSTLKEIARLSVAERMENASLRRQISEKDEALKPFADMAKNWSPEANGGHIFGDDERDEAGNVVGDFRRAARALKGDA